MKINLFSAPRIQASEESGHQWIRKYHEKAANESARNFVEKWPIFILHQTVFFQNDANLPPHFKLSKIYK